MDWWDLISRAVSLGAPGVLLALVVMRERGFGGAVRRTLRITERDRDQWRRRALDAEAELKQHLKATDPPADMIGDNTRDH